MTTIVVVVSSIKRGFSMTSSILPSIWVADFSSQEAFSVFWSSEQATLEVMSDLDDRHLVSRHPLSWKAWCASCRKVTLMTMHWHFCGGNSEGAVHPAWTEVNACEVCGLNSRMRALRSALDRYKIPSSAPIFLAESVTPSYSALKKDFPHLIGSEYLGHGIQPGAEVYVERLGVRVRHEDLRQLSFQEGAFEVVLTQDVFEHIPDYRAALKECFRVLSPGGRLLFTIPFFWDQTETFVRVSLGVNGEMIHHAPPEVHGNPTTGEGALCYQNFGWDLLDDLDTVGFVDSEALLYWGPWAGHLGSPFFVFTAKKSRD